MDKVSDLSQGQQPQYQVDYHQQLPDIRLVGEKKTDVIEPHNSIGDTSHIFTELRDDNGEHSISRTQNSTERDGHQSSECIPPIIDPYEGEERMDTRVVAVKDNEDNDDLRSVVLDETTEISSSRDLVLSQGQQAQHLTIRMGVAKVNDITKRQTSPNNTSDVSDKMREDKGECTITENPAARDDYQSIECFPPITDLSESDRIKNPGEIWTEDNDIPTVVLDNMTEISSSRDVDTYNLYHGLKQYNDKHEEVKDERLIFGKESNKMQAIAVDENMNRHISAPVGDFIKKITKRETNPDETTRLGCQTSGTATPLSAPLEAVQGNENTAYDSGHKTYDCNMNHYLQLHAKTPERFRPHASMDKRETVGLLREFPPLSPPKSAVTANEPTKNIKTMFTSFTTGFKNRKKNVGEEVRDVSQSNEIFLPVSSTIEVTRVSCPVEEDHDLHQKPYIELNHISNVPRVPKSRGKNNINSLLKDFPPLPPIVMNESSDKIQNKKPRRRVFEFGRARNFMSSVRTITSKDSVLTTPSSTKYSDHSGRRTSISSRKSLTQRFSMRSIGFKGNGGHISKLQEERWKQEDLVRDALIRHRALTSDLSKGRSTETDNTDTERCCQTRLMESDTWKKAFGYVESDSTSQSSHEDAVSVETALSDVTMESEKMPMHMALAEVAIVIPDVICLYKSKRGFFGKKKLW